MTDDRSLPAVEYLPVILAIPQPENMAPGHEGPFRRGGHDEGGEDGLGQRAHLLPIPPGAQAVQGRLGTLGEPREDDASILWGDGQADQGDGAEGGMGQVGLQGMGPRASPVQAAAQPEGRSPHVQVAEPFRLAHAEEGDMHPAEGQGMPGGRVSSGPAESYGQGEEEQAQGHEYDESLCTWFVHDVIVRVSA